MSGFIENVLHGFTRQTNAQRRREKHPLPSLLPNPLLSNSPNSFLFVQETIATTSCKTANIAKIL
jgi:hypothetical protein